MSRKKWYKLWEKNHGFNIENDIIVTTLPLETTILFESTIPTSLTTLLETEKESTSLTSIPDLNL